MLKDNQITIKADIEKISENYLSGLPPILATFQLSGIVTRGDICLLFRIAPMHQFSLGISLMPRECAWNFLEDRYITS